MTPNIILKVLLGLIALSGKNDTFYLKGIELYDTAEIEIQLYNESDTNVYLVENARSPEIVFVEFDKDSLFPHDTTSVILGLYVKDTLKKGNFSFTISGKKFYLVIEFYNHFAPPFILEHLTRSLLIFDTRPIQMYNQCHIMGSEPIRFDLLLMYLTGMKADVLPRQQEIYIIAVDDSVGIYEADTLRKLGYVNTYVIKGGLRGWQARFGKKYLFCKH